VRWRPNSHWCECRGKRVISAAPLAPGRRSVYLPTPLTSSFPVTRWSLVAAAGTCGDSAQAQKALGEICRAYWFPLYSFARRRGLPPEDAEDATQSFFATLLERNFLATADGTLGRLRTFLLTAFSGQLIDERRAAGRQKRGGGAEFISLDFGDAEERLNASVAATNDEEPVCRFEAAWAAALVEGAVQRLEADYAASGRGPLFGALLPYLGTSAGEPPDQAQLAATLGMSHVAFRQSLSRFRERFRHALRAQVADTLRQPTEEAINDELRILQSVLSARPVA